MENVSVERGDREKRVVVRPGRAIVGELVSKQVIEKVEVWVGRGARWRIGRKDIIRR